MDPSLDVLAVPIMVLDHSGSANDRPWVWLKLPFLLLIVVVLVLVFALVNHHEPLSNLLTHLNQALPTTFNRQCFRLMSRAAMGQFLMATRETRTKATRIGLTSATPD